MNLYRITIKREGEETWECYVASRNSNDAAEYADRTLRACRVLIAEVRVVHVVNMLEIHYATDIDVVEVDCG